LLLRDGETNREVRPQMHQTGNRSTTPPRVLEIVTHYPFAEDVLSYASAHCKIPRTSSP